MKNSIHIAAVGLLISACAASGPIPDANSTSSAVEYMDALVDATTPKNLDRFIETMEDGRANGYRWYKGWWCPRHETVAGVAAIRREVSAFCEAKGGQLLSNGMCRDETDHDRVHFVAHIWKTQECSVAETVSVDVIEPTGASDHSGYVKALRRFGYVTADEIRAAAEERRRESEELIQQFEQQRELDAQAAIEVLASETGTRICKAGVIDYVHEPGVRQEKRKSGTLVAQLDGKSEQGTRIRFRVLGYQVPELRNSEETYSHSFRMSEFAINPGIVYWDEADGWRLCE